MGKKWYQNSAAKGLLAALAIAAAAAGGGLGMYMLSLISQNGYPIGARPGSYASSAALAGEMENAFRGIVSSIWAKEMLTERTADGKDRLIDLQAVLDAPTSSDFFTDAGSGLVYRAADLKKWAAQGWTYTQGGPEEELIVCKRYDGTYDYYPYQEFVREMTDVHIYFPLPDLYEESELSLENCTLDLLEHIRGGEYDRGFMEFGTLSGEKQGTPVQYTDFWNYNGSLIREEYTPVGADSLLDVVRENEAWNGRLNDAVRALESLLSRYREAIVVQQQFLRYEEGNTNLAYLYVDMDKKEVYTNRGAYAGYRNYPASLEDFQKKYGAYVIVRPSLSECETTFDTDFSEWQEIASGAGGGNYIAAIGMDTRFAVADAYAQMARQYARYAGYIGPLFAGCVLALALFLLCLAPLTAAAGRREGDPMCRLCFFDRWHLEAVVLGALLITLAEASFMLTAWESAPKGELILSAVLCTGSLGAMFLAIYLSVVRRIKAGTLYQSTLLCFLAGRVRAFFRFYAHNTAVKVKATLAICGYFLMASLAVLVIDNRNSLVLLLLLSGLAVLALGMKKLSEQDQLLEAAVESSLKNERMKTELITNVSHDIKTPLTSIINYVGLLKREDFEEPRIREYIEVLEKKAQRLKTLTEDVVEAAKASSGTISLEIAELDFAEMTRQVIGEFKEKLEQENLILIPGLPDQPVFICADGRRMWRVLENVFQNVAKYAMKGTRVYVDLKTEGEQAVFSLKNISAQPLNFSADELTERFIRGDMARNTEGSGLGLSIARDLAELQGGTFKVYVDGDLFRVQIAFPCRTSERQENA